MFRIAVRSAIFLGVFCFWIHMLADSSAQQPNLGVTFALTLLLIASAVELSIHIMWRYGHRGSFE